MLACVLAWPVAYLPMQWVWNAACRWLDELRCLLCSTGPGTLWAGVLDPDILQVGMATFVLLAVVRWAVSENVACRWEEVVLGCELAPMPLDSGTQELVAWGDAADHPRQKLRATDGGYRSWRSIDAGTVEASSHVVRAMCLLRAGYCDEEAVALAVRCQREHGFGVWRGAAAARGPTYHSLHMLDCLGRVDAVACDAHRTWLVEQLSAADVRRAINLRCIWYAAECLGLVGHGSGDGRADVREGIAGAWRASGKGLAETWWAVRSLSLLGGVPADMKRELEAEWLTAHALEARNLRVERHLLGVWYFVQVARALGCEASVNVDGMLRRMAPRIISHVTRCLAELSRA